MQTRLTLDRDHFELLPRDTHVVEAAESRRLAGQNMRVLERLRQGPATRDDLSAIARNPTARISDLRAAGYVIPPPLENRVTGESVYRLAGEPKDLT